MYTKCPACHMFFQVSAEQLRVAGGQVRCGRCQTVFNALNTLTESRPKGQGENETGKPAPDSTGEPQIDSTPDATSPAATIYSDPSPASIGEFAFPEGLDSGEERAGGNTALWAIANLLLIAAFLAQSIWVFRDELAADERLRPMMVKFCDLAGCELGSWRDPALISILDRDIRADGTQPEVLRVNLQLVNTAGREQPYPILQLTLARFDGAIIGLRRFRPSEYLADSAPAQQILPPDQPAQITFDLVDPGEEAASFKFDIL